MQILAMMHRRKRQVQGRLVAKVAQLRVRMHPVVPNRAKWLIAEEKRLRHEHRQRLRIIQSCESSAMTIVENNTELYGTMRWQKMRKIGSTYQSCGELENSSPHSGQERKDMRSGSSYE